MNISLSNAFNNSNPLMSRTSENDNPLQNAFSRHTKQMQERIDRIRARQQESMKARMLEEKLENCILTGANVGMDPILTKAIVSADMAMGRIEGSYRTKTAITNRIATEGETPELQEALLRASATLAVQIGQALASIEEYNAAIARAREQENSEQSYEVANSSTWDIPQNATGNNPTVDNGTENGINQGSPSSDSPNTYTRHERASNAGYRQARLVSAYRSSPPSGLIVNSAT